MREPPLAEPIAAGQFFWLHAASIVTGGVFLWPAPLLAGAGRDAVGAFVFSLLLVLALTALRFAWIGYVGVSALPVLLARTWGRAGAWLLLVLMTLVVSLPLAAAVLALFGEMMTTFFYPRLPLWVLEGTPLAVAVLLGRARLADLARNVAFWFPLVGGVTLFLLGMGLANLQDAGAMLPAAALDPADLWRGVAGSWFLWNQCVFVEAAAGVVRGRPGRRLRRLALLGAAFLGLCLLGFLGMALGTLGPEVAGGLRWPLVYLFSALNIHQFFVTRLALLGFFSWVVTFVLFQAIYLFFLAYHWQIGLGLGDRGRRLLVLALALFTLAGALILNTAHAAQSLLLGVISPLCLAAGLSITPLSLLKAALAARRQYSQQRTVGDGSGAGRPGAG
ncbi:putative Spore germination protein [Candidatus Hydrogenisulfobacillus filiaventi]|uniref:Putative Spore germination protein n=1 Tax=Candidatus Hydrogenisulfobacillus filiaventi TaxID=2707344 RepID=A0A6F8ZET5_9FIRM|nr:GerAB/ArcD/ProY family transporter [Bacillota bacterium]CAB1128441.1 putative Spore germination protein [Candidatus Hydrogenisulfobacillus filiaventi]